MTLDDGTTATLGRRRGRSFISVRFILLLLSIYTCAYYLQWTSKWAPSTIDYFNIEKRSHPITTKELVVEEYGPEESETTRRTANVTDSRTNKKTTKASKMSSTCESLWEWPSLDTGWHMSKQKNGKPPDTYRFTAARSNAHPTAQGTISMTVQQNKTNNKTTAAKTIRIDVAHPDACSDNVWHRMAVQYMAWIALQVTLRHFDVVVPSPASDNAVQVVYVLNQCHHQHTSPPQGWSDLGNVTFGGGVAPASLAAVPAADLIVTPPTDGLLWDLAWDMNFDCAESDMFETFVNAYLNNSNTAASADAATTTTHDEPSAGCFVSRRGSKQRRVANRAALLDMMRQEFGASSEVKEIYITTSNTTRQVVDAMRPCHVIVGVHGAGMYNTIFARNSAGIVEVLPNPGNPPAYYRNINMLLGHYYEGVQGQFRMGEQTVTVDVDAVRAAVRRAWAYHNNSTGGQ